MKMLKSIEEVPTRREMRTLDRLDANTTADRLEDMTEIMIDRLVDMTEIIIDRLEEIMGITTAQTTVAITTTFVAMETVDMETATVDHIVETITVLMVTDETIDLSEETVIDQTTVTEMIMNTNNNNKKRKMVDMMRHPSRWVENLLKTTIRNITSVDRQIKKIAK